MKKIHKGLNTFLDIIDLYFPIVAFVILFVFYFILILLRYFFGTSIGWMYETMSIVFVWSIVLSASKGSRHRDAVSFNLLYDHVSTKWKHIIEIIYNTIIVVLFSYSMPKFWKTLMSNSITKTSSMKIPYTIVFFPFIIFIVSMICYHFRDMVRAVYFLIHPEKEIIANEEEVREEDI